MRLMLVIAAAGMMSGASFGGTIEVLASKDNTLYQTGDGSLSNGSGPSIFVGRNGQGAARRAVVAFDLTDAVPDGMVVTSATLRLYVAQTIVGATSVSAHRLLADWGEGDSVAEDGNGGGGAPAEAGDATWLHTFYPDAFWAQPGGDYEAAASATTTVGGEGMFYTWTGEELTADVAGWLEDPSTNFGWVLVSNSPSVPSSKRFTSREGFSVFVPKLILETEAVVVPCVTDLNGSGGTDSVDLNIVLSGFGCVGGGCAGDVDGDGDTDSTDLNAVLASFGQPCP